MKLGIAGTGNIIGMMMEGTKELHFEKRYIYGRNPGKARALCEKYELDGLTANFDELLQLDIDTVYVALPNHLHATFAKKALEKGKHVIIEKPITVTEAELKELIELAKEKCCMILEAMNIHSLPAYQELQKAVSEIGAIKIVSFNYSQYSSRYDAFKKGVIQPAFDPKMAGGALMDLNVYNIHAVLGLFGAAENVHYMANIERDIDTSGILTLGYPNFQAVCIGAKDCQAPVTLTIQGDKGVIKMDTPVNALTSFELILNDGSSRRFEVSEVKHRLYYEFIDFMHILETGDEAEADRRLEISCAAVEILEKARKAAGMSF